MNIYLAGPIDHEPDMGKGWREEFKERCKTLDNVLCFDPTTAFSLKSVNGLVAKYIHDVNMAALDHAEVVVVRMMKGQKTTMGTPIEMYRFIERGGYHKKMIVLTDIDISVYMQVILNAHNVVKVNNIDEAFEEVQHYRNQLPKALVGLMGGLKKVPLEEHQLVAQAEKVR